MGHQKSALKIFKKCTRNTRLKLPKVKLLVFCVFFFTTIHPWPLASLRPVLQICTTYLRLRLFPCLGPKAQGGRLGDLSFSLSWIDAFTPDVPCGRGRAARRRKMDMLDVLFPDYVPKLKLAPLVERAIRTAFTMGLSLQSL